MSTMSQSPSSDIQPLHHPEQAAVVQQPTAPLGNVTNGQRTGAAPGMGAKALLAKKMAKGNNPTYVSPTDNMLTPCTAKLNQAKKKHYNKAKPIRGPLFAQPSSLSESSSTPDEEEEGSSKEEDNTSQSQESQAPLVDEENPF